MLGQVVEGRYIIEAELGEGTMGRVYRARHVKLARHVAIKAMHRELACVPLIVERFAREASIAAKLRHPNVVSVLDVGTMPDRRPMIVLELAPGKSLAELIQGPLGQARAIELTRQLLRGLLHAHSAGLIHRDLKPDNILVEQTKSGLEIARIVDFGIAVKRARHDQLGDEPRDDIEGRRLTEVNGVIGTPFYMSPEQSRAEPLDHRSDLFSLGLIVYEMLAGVPPFSGTSFDVTVATATRDPPAIEDLTGVIVDPALEAFARKLMARRREDRFLTAADALDELARIANRRPLVVSTEIAQLPRPRFAVAAALVMIIATIMMIVAIVISSRALP